MADEWVKYVSAKELTALIPDPVDLVIHKMIVALTALESRDREKVFIALNNTFCQNCGEDDPSCQCWNDE